MAANLPDRSKKGDLQDPFREWFHSMNDLFHKGPIKGLLESMDELFSTPFTSFYVDVRENSNEHLISAELPGIKKEQIIIDAFENSLTLTVNHEEIVTAENNREKLYKRKESFQQLIRRIYLGHPINKQKIKATFKNGLLQIRVPKEKGNIIDIKEE